MAAPSLNWSRKPPYGEQGSINRKILKICKLRISPYTAAEHRYCRLSSRDLHFLKTHTDRRQTDKTAAVKLLGIVGQIASICLFTHRLQSRERAGCKSSNKTLVPHHTIQCCKAGLNVTHQTWSCILVRQNICQKFGVLSSLTPRLISPRGRG